MKALVYTCLVILALVVQTTMFPSWSFLVVTPDLILVLTVILALLNGPKFGAIFGFLAGLGLDLMVGELIGLNALTKMLVGGLVGLGALRFYKENYIVPLISVVAATIFDRGLYLVGMLVFGLNLSGFFLVKLLLPLVLYNGVIILLLYWRIYELNKKVAVWAEQVKRAG